MNKEPIALYIFRFLMGFGLFAFMVMLYWSSLLVEEDLKGLKEENVEIKKELNSIKSSLNHWQDNFQENVQKANQTVSTPSSTSSTSNAPLYKDSSKKGGTSTANRPHINSKYPNLLQVDTFYAVTLPEMLGVGFQPHGTRQGASIGKPNNVHPFSNWAEVAEWNGMCNVTLAQLAFGKYETFCPNMAIKVEARPMDEFGNPEYWIHLRDEVYWNPLNPKHFSEDVHLAPHFLEKHKVTAHDFKFFWDALMNPYVQEAGAVAQRVFLGDIKEIEIIDDLTFVVRWNTHEIVQEDGKKVPKIKYVAKSLTGELRPLASFVYKYFPDGKKVIEDDSNPNTYRTNSVWGQNFNLHWAKNIIPSCGSWIFDGMSDRQIQFKRNPEHYSSLDVLVKGLVMQFKNTSEAIWQDFKANQLDLYSLRPEQLSELEEFLKSDLYKKQKEENAGVKRLDYLMRAYVYIGWNEARPYFTSKKVRQAMTMAIDRKRIINQNLNGLGIEITGSFFLKSPSYNPKITPLPFDPMMAKRLLEEEGWFDSDGDGILDKEINGKRVPFEFTLTYFVKNVTTKAIVEYVSTALKQIGVVCRLNGVDVADLSKVFDDKNFDALCLGWAFGTPPEDPKQLWSSEGAKQKGSSNAIGFSNKEADEIIEKLQFEDNQKKRLELYHRFHAILHEEQPYTFLYTPKIAMVYRDYLENVFIPADRQDLIPGANIAEPDSKIFWKRDK